ncbi:hypothetical protein [Burkholderia sp. A9]|uniref:hypothetical protein n=1 Tax=Burkholderia sp. A9 TaxID=1365108 RepID=UPI001F3A62DF|nr:hypothetical protein [Burkholderia sp. A9]
MRRTDFFPAHAKCHLRNRRRPENTVSAGHDRRSHFATFPAISFVGFGYFLYAMIGNVSLMAGTSSVVVSILPWSTPAIAVAGAIFAAWLRHVRPAVYARLGRFLSDS